MENSRKRLRSQENDGMQQRKFFINQRIVDRNDKNLMQKVYEKTLYMMFSSSKNCHKKSGDNKHENSIESDDMEDKLDTVEDKLETPIGCKFCMNAIDPDQSSACSNCNLNACQRCHTTCLYCSALLCINCVNLFGCALISDDNSATPICEDCKKFI